MMHIESSPWMRDALCLEYPSEWWFPESGASDRRARKICRDCLVREECLAHALEAKERHGVWGGCNSKDMARLRRARWDTTCRLCRRRIPLADVAALVVARTETSRWCCRACHDEQLRQLGAAS